MELVRSCAHMDAHGTLADGSPNPTVAAEASDALAWLLADGEKGPGEKARGACGVFYVGASSSDFF